MFKEMECKKKTQVLLFARTDLSHFLSINFNLTGQKRSPCVLHFSFENGNFIFCRMCTFSVNVTFI